MKWAAAACGLVVAAAVAASCGSDGTNEETPGSQLASRETMLDSAFCGACHREQYEEWAGSMHAYAADDPIFRALNTRMQREVPPEQQQFCLQCHAPMAVRLGQPTDFATLDARPELKGVGCIFCHSVTTVTGPHNNPLVLDDGPTMFGAIRDPIDPVVHKAEYNPLVDGTSDGQSGLCGPCHDIVTPGGAHIERTFREWSQSKFGLAGQTKTSCAACHMPGRDGPAAVVAGAPQRRVHDHAMPGVDLALTPFPHKEDQRARVQRLLDDSVVAQLCVSPAATGGADIQVVLRSEQVGHGFPSGSNQDRRAWVELTAYRAGAVVLTNGHVADGESVERSPDAVAKTMLLLRDHDYDAEGNPTELFWRTTSYTSNQIAPASLTSTSRPGYEETAKATFHVADMPDRVEMAVKIRPIDVELLEELEKSGDLDRSKLDPITTFTLARTKLTWDAAAGAPCTP